RRSKTARASSICCAATRRTSFNGRRSSAAPSGWSSATRPCARGSRSPATASSVTSSSKDWRCSAVCGAANPLRVTRVDRVLDSTVMRAIVCVWALLLPSLASAKAQPQPLAQLDRAKLVNLAPLLRGAELSLIESTEQGHIKQLTTISLVNAPPAEVRELVAHPEHYGDFVRNMSESTIKPDAEGGTFVHQYRLSYKVYSVEGRHRYVMLPPELGDAVPPVDMYDPDDNGRRHYKWQFLAAEGGGTILVLYGFTVIPQDGFMKQYMDRAQTLELGLGLIPQLTLQLAVKERAE